MTKYIKIISIFIFSILLISCGFKRISQDDRRLVKIQNIKIVGDKRISYLLKNNILIISNKNAKNTFEIEIKTKKKTTNKIKNSAGKVIRFNMNITANLVLKNINKLESIKKTFTSNIDYNVAETHSDTIINENAAIINIIEQISDDIINFMTFSLSN